MPTTKFEIRVLLRHYWKRGLTTRDACKEICDVEGEGIVAQRTAAKWFKRFNDGDLNLEDKPRSGRPSLLGDDELITALKDNPSSSSRDLAVWCTSHDCPETFTSTRFCPQKTTTRSTLPN